MSYLKSNLFTTFLALVVVTASGQSPAPNPELGTKRVDALNLSHGLPPYYEGVDFKALIDQLTDSDSSRAKSQFESSSEYESRLARPPNLTGNLKSAADHALTLVLTPKMGGPSFTGVDLSYDADTELFTFQLHFLSGRSILTPGSPVLARMELSSALTHADDVEGTTGLGIKVRMSDLGTRVYGIAIDPRSWLVNSSTYAPTRKISFHVSRNGAEFVESQLRLALVGRLEKPWLAHWVTISDATVQLPTRLTTVENDFVFEPIEMLVFRNDTGDVLRTDDMLGPTFPSQFVEKTVQPTENSTTLGGIPPATEPLTQHLPTNVISGSFAVYPPIAKATHVSGSVVLHFIIDKTGKPYDISALSGHPFLVQAAINAAKTWRYKPYMKDGVPTEVDTEATVNFSLSAK